MGLPHMTYAPPPASIHLDDRVSVSGRVGSVIGFYRGAETVLVRFDSGESAEHAQKDLAIEAQA
jgi:hypothetical protein